ncbi:MAG TPA: hypothetical protein DEG76_03980 [Pseudohongiella sp.]|nr:hypothetical protein [Pseudohongiella sp.]
MRHDFLPSATGQQGAGSWAGRNAASIDFWLVLIQFIQMLFKRFVKASPTTKITQASAYLNQQRLGICGTDIITYAQSCGQRLLHRKARVMDGIPKGATA